MEVKLRIDPSEPSVAQPARRIPFHLGKKIEQELAQLEQQGIIEKVEGPTTVVPPAGPYAPVLTGISSSLPSFHSLFTVAGYTNRMLKNILIVNMLCVENVPSCT